MWLDPEGWSEPQAESIVHTTMAPAAKAKMVAIFKEWTSVAVISRCTVSPDYTMANFHSKSAIDVPGAHNSSYVINTRMSISCAGLRHARFSGEKA